MMSKNDLKNEQWERFKPLFLTEKLQKGTFFEDACRTMVFLMGIGGNESYTSSLYPEIDS